MKGQINKIGRHWWFPRVVEGFLRQISVGGLIYVNLRAYVLRIAPEILLGTTTYYVDLFEVLIHHGYQLLREKSDVKVFFNDLFTKRAITINWMHQIVHPFI